MAGLDFITILYGTFAVILVLNNVEEINAGECCKAHEDIVGLKHDAVWCDDYCCGTSIVGLICCDNILLQALPSDRQAICWNFFASMVWVPIVASIGILAILICCCVGCVKCCCQSNRPGMVIVPQQQAGTNVVMAQQQPSHVPYAQLTNPPVAGAQAYQPAPVVQAPAYQPAPVVQAPAYPPGSALPQAQNPAYPPTPAYPTKDN